MTELLKLLLKFHEAYEGFRKNQLNELNEIEDFLPNLDIKQPHEDQLDRFKTLNSSENETFNIAKPFDEAMEVASKEVDKQNTIFSLEKHLANIMHDLEAIKKYPLTLRKKQEEIDQIAKNCEINMAEESRKMLEKINEQIQKINELRIKHNLLVEDFENITNQGGIILNKLNERKADIDFLSKYIEQENTSHGQFLSNISHDLKDLNSSLRTISEGSLIQLDKKNEEIWNLINNDNYQGKLLDSLKPGSLLDSGIINVLNELNVYLEYQKNKDSKFYKSLSEIHNILLSISNKIKEEETMQAIKDIYNKCKQMQPDTLLKVSRVREKISKLSLSVSVENDFENKAKILSEKYNESLNHTHELMYSIELKKTYPAKMLLKRLVKKKSDQQKEMITKFYENINNLYINSNDEREINQQFKSILDISGVKLLTDEFGNPCISYLGKNCTNSEKITKLENVLAGLITAKLQRRIFVEKQSKALKDVSEEKFNSSNIFKKLAEIHSPISGLNEFHFTKADKELNNRVNKELLVLNKIVDSENEKFINSRGIDKKIKLIEKELQEIKIIIAKEAIMESLTLTYKKLIKQIQDTYKANITDLNEIKKIHADLGFENISENQSKIIYTNFNNIKMSRDSFVDITRKNGFDNNLDVELEQHEIQREKLDGMIDCRERYPLQTSRNNLEQQKEVFNNYLLNLEERKNTLSLSNNTDKFDLKKIISDLYPDQEDLHTGEIISSLAKDSELIDHANQNILLANELEDNTTRAYRSSINDKIFHCESQQHLIQAALDITEISVENLKQQKDIIENRIKAIKQIKSLEDAGSKLLVKGKLNIDLLLAYRNTNRKRDGDNPNIQNEYFSKDEKIGDRTRQLEVNENEIIGESTQLHLIEDEMISDRTQLHVNEDGMINNRTQLYVNEDEMINNRTLLHIKTRRRVDAIINDEKIVITNIDNKKPLQDVKGVYFEAIRDKLINSEAFSKFRDHVNKHVEGRTEKSDRLSNYLSKFENPIVLSMTDNRVKNLYDLISLVKCIPIQPELLPKSGFSEQDYREIQKQTGFFKESTTKNMINELNKELNNIIHGEFYYHTIYNEINDKIDEQCQFNKNQEEAELQSYFDQLLNEVRSDNILSGDDRENLINELHSINDSHSCSIDNKKARMQTAKDLFYENARYHKKSELINNQFNPDPDNRFSYLYEKLKVDVFKSLTKRTNAVQELWRALNSIDQESAWDDIEKIRRMANIVQEVRDGVKQSESSFVTFFTGGSRLVRVLNDFINLLNKEPEKYPEKWAKYQRNNHAVVNLQDFAAGNEQKYPGNSNEI